MAKILPTVALLLVLMAHASSAYRTIITTVELDDSSQSCRQEAERRDLSACEQLIRRPRRSSYEDELELENPQEQQMRQCCSQLNQVREDCKCEALRFVVEQQVRAQQQRQQGREEAQKIRQRARQIPSSCGISQCEMRSVFF